MQDRPCMQKSLPLEETRSHPNFIAEFGIIISNKIASARSIFLSWHIPNSKQVNPSPFRICCCVTSQTTRNDDVIQGHKSLLARSAIDCCQQTTNERMSTSGLIVSHLPFRVINSNVIN
jgi:hypothetical protein